MVVKWIAYGKALEKGISLYNQTQYTEAKQCFLKAIHIDNNDFVANFWLLRTSTMLQEYESAEKLALLCTKLEPDLSEQLIVPWQERIRTQYKDFFDETLNKLNSDTTLLLESLQRDRSFELGSLVFLVLTAVLLVFFLVRLPKSFVEFVLYLFIALFYYQKPRLVPNLWIEGKRALGRIKKMILTPSFIVLLALNLVGVAVFLFLYWWREGNFYEYKKFTDAKLLVSALSLVVAPIIEEIFFRGVLFNYAKTHLGYWAYPIVSALNYISFGSTASIDQFVISWFSCWVYGRYGTLWAPISFHWVQNIPRAVLIYYAI